MCLMSMRARTTHTHTLSEHAYLCQWIFCCCSKRKANSKDVAPRFGPLLRNSSHLADEVDAGRMAGQNVLSFVFIFISFTFPTSCCFSCTYTHVFTYQTKVQQQQLPAQTHTCARAGTRTRPLFGLIH